MIELADPATAPALLAAARQVVARAGTVRVPFVGQRTPYAADVCLRSVDRGDPRRIVYGQTHRVAIRVDVVHARAHCLPSEVEAVDEWLTAQEWALDCLWSDDRPVFGADLRLGIDVQQGGSHRITDGRNRMSLWYVFRDRTAARVTA